MKDIKYKFDERFHYGSSENFFHFMWGYLLPAIVEICKHQENQRIFEHYYFHSCGPLMDQISHNLLSLFHINYLILDKKTFKDQKALFKRVPRWDVWAKKNKPTRKEKSSLSKIANRIHYRLMRLLLLDTRKNSVYIQDIQQARKEVIKKIRSTHKSDLTCKNIILKRSESPNYYKKGGPAEYHHFGTAIRSLSGIEKTIDNLKNHNFIFESYEPGIHPIDHQINSFAEACTVIGIRGAEYANMIWMQPGSKIIMIKPKEMPPSVQKEIAEILQIRYFEIETEENYPDLSKINLKPLLNYE
ncbi:MAG: glycosyltransferase family 61 protein [Candidatus Marinimicrobia bacterium]|nr:glycosyltransferase family 61 protein [Candidatus Neomarinimicrobiota bacterium]